MSRATGSSTFASIPVPDEGRASSEAFVPSPGKPREQTEGGLVERKGSPGESEDGALEAEVRRLRRENAKLLMERELQKRAAATLAKK